MHAGFFRQVRAHLRYLEDREALEVDAAPVLPKTLPDKDMRRNSYPPLSLRSKSRRQIVILIYFFIVPYFEIGDEHRPLF